MEDYIPTSPNIDNDTTSLSSIAVGDVSEQNADIVSASLRFIYLLLLNTIRRSLVPFSTYRQRFGPASAS